MTTDSTAFQHLWLVLENHRPVAVHSHLIRIAGSAKAAVFLSQLVYWTRRCPTALSTPGWVHKTSTQWFRELGLSRREQESARAALKGLDVLEEALCGQPAMRYYRLRLPQLGNLLAVRLGLQLSDPEPSVLWADEALVRDLLGRALPYHRILAYLTGSVNAALLLTRVIFQHRRHLHVQGWFRFSRRDMERDLGLTRWELDTARKCLRGKCFVEERLEHLPTRLYARAVPPAIASALRRLASEQTVGTDQEATVRRSANPIGGIAADPAAQKRQSNSRHSRQSACTKTTPQFGGKPPLSLAENLPSNNGLITGVHLTTTTSAVAPTIPQASSEEVVVVLDSSHTIAGERVSRHGCLTVRRPEVSSRPSASYSPPGADETKALIFPADFLPEEREIAAAELAALRADRAQLVLDEVDGRSRKQRSVHTRVGLVRSLAQAEHQGRFHPAYAWEVRDIRRRMAQREAERQARESRDQGIAHHVAPCAGGKAGYEAFKELTARWPRLPAAGIPDQQNQEDLS